MNKQLEFNCTMEFQDRMVVNVSARGVRVHAHWPVWLSREDVIILVENLNEYLETTAE